ncbi:MAG TPA: hypothetical protein PLM75_00635 [bacterium]|nr:hypothetical protein [bacterium]HPP86352.1 hypothetical protein [bacterium]
MKQTNKNLVVWEFENLLSAVESGQFQKISVNKLENLVLKELPKHSELAADALPKMESLAISLARSLNRISISERSKRDDIILIMSLLYSVLGKDSKVADLISDIQNKKIEGINQKFILDKLHNYREKGGKLANSHKIWSKLVRAYNRGEISAIQGKSKKVDKLVEQELKKNFFQKLIEFIGL